MADKHVRSIQDAIHEARLTGIFTFTGTNESNNITELPDAIRDFKDLHRLILNQTQIHALPTWLTKFRLKELHIDRSPLTEFPPVITEMKSLRYLGITRCGLNLVPQEMGALIHLRVLELSGNRIAELPSSIWKLLNLRVLDLAMNPLISLPPNSERLQNLTHLYLWGHSFNYVPSALGTLNSLEVLDLSAKGTKDLRGQEGDASPNKPPETIYNRMVGGPSGLGALRIIPTWFGVSLPNLRELYLGSQGIAELPEGFEAMSRLQKLFLANNHLPDIPSAVLKLPLLHELDLRANSITELTVDIKYLQRLTYFDLADNPLPIPPEVLEEPHNPSLILDYVSRLNQSTDPLNEAKLLIVGEGSVGKTSLVNRLVRNTYVGNESKTEGIDVTRWTVPIDSEEITLNVWDFGGQEIMHATHQFFLTKRSVYVLVIDARQGEEQNRIEYWLKLIHGFSRGSPVVIVGNKSDQSVLDIDQRGLKTKYSNIVDIISVSCLSGIGVDEVKEIIVRTVGRLAHVRDLLPTAFFEIKQYLEELDVNYLSFGEYEKLCVAKGVTSKSVQELLIDFLHDLGTVLCFRDDPRLADTNILNPSWVTGGVYRLLNSNLAAQRKGLLKWRDIDSILDTDDYPSERRFFIIDMMRKFELCYEADQVFLIPDLLTKEEPDTGDWDNALHFEIKYDVLPSSIISRLIVRMSSAISKSTVWRTGMVLAMDRNRALVKGDREDSAITIEVSGSQNGRRGLLTAVRTELRGIERTIPGLTGEERVPVPNHPGIWVPYSHLLDLEAAGRQTVVPQGLTEDFNIRDLLAGIEVPKDRATEQEAVLKGDVESKVIVDSDDVMAKPWTVRDSMKFGWLLIAAIVLILAAFIGAYELLNVSAAAAIGATLTVVVIIGLFILRSSGRISEGGFFDSVKGILMASKDGQNGTSPD